MNINEWDVTLKQIESYRDLQRKVVLDNPDRAKNCSPKDFIGRRLSIGDYVAYSIKFPVSGMELGYITEYHPPTVNPEGNPDGGYVVVNRAKARTFGKLENRIQFRAEGKNLVKLSQEEMTLYLLEKGTK